MYLGDFPALFLLLISSLISLCLRNTLYDFNAFKFVSVFSMAQNVVYFVHLRMCILLLLEFSTNVNSNKLINNIVQIYYILTDFLLTWSITEKGVMKSPTLSGFMYFPFWF